MYKQDLIVKNKNFKSLNEIFNLQQKFTMISGPCSVESVDQMERVASCLVENGIKFIRGGAFKPRTSPYDFQGLGVEGLKILDYIRKKYGLLVVSEILDTRDVEFGVEYTDIIQIGSRNMQNYSLLKEVGKTNHPVLLKRGMMCTVEEFLLAAEYIVKNGNENIILCERGIRTFENSTRNTLDVSCIAIVKQYTTLPIIVDLSHALGRKDIIPLMGKLLLNMQIDGYMLEVCPDDTVPLSDKEQQLTISEFSSFLKTLFPEGYKNFHQSR